MTNFQLLLTTFLHLNSLILVSGNYTLNITLVSYLNYNNWCSECSDDELGCCDNYDSTECTGSFRCDTYFEYCLLPVDTAITRDRLPCNPVATSTVLTDDGPIDFTQSVVLGLSNPLQLSGTSNTWTGTLLQISALDWDGSSSYDLIDVFHLRIDNEVGSVVIAGYHNLTRMELAYQIVCNDGFYGDACQFINDCPSLDACGENGACIDGNNSYSCRCDDGYKGDHCEFIDHCLGVNCSGQGQCTGDENSYTCLCYAGSTGMNCEISFDDCASVNCSGQGECMDGNSSYACACNPGFTGDDCAINIDDCVNNSCSGKGDCIEETNSFRCNGEAGIVQSRLVLIIGVTLGGFSFLLFLLIMFLTIVITLCRTAHWTSNKSQVTESALKRHENFNLTGNIGYGVVAEQANEGHCYDEIGPRQPAAVCRGDMESHSMNDYVL